MEDLFERDNFEVVRPSLADQDPATTAAATDTAAYDDEPLFVTENRFGDDLKLGARNRRVNNHDSDEEDFGYVGTQYYETNNDDEVTGANGGDASAAGVASGNADDVLGLDNVSVKSRRKLVTLSQDQLLSNFGLQYLKQNFTKRVKLKSSTQYRKIYKKDSRDPNKYEKKKHISFSTEYDNATQLLRFYQLWAHKVYPKANFNDFVLICYNKQVLHKGRLNYYRKQWITDEQDLFFNTHQEEQEREQAEAEAQAAASADSNHLSSANGNDNTNDNTNENVEFSDSEMNAVVGKSNGLFVGEDSDVELQDQDEVNKSTSNKVSSASHADGVSAEIIRKHRAPKQGLFVGDDNSDDDDDLYHDRTPNTLQPPPSATASLEDVTTNTTNIQNNSKNNELKVAGKDDDKDKSETVDVNKSTPNIESSVTINKSTNKQKDGDENNSNNKDDAFDDDDFADDDDDDDDAFWSQIGTDKSVPSKLSGNSANIAPVPTPEVPIPSYEDDGDEYEDEMDVLREMGL